MPPDTRKTRTALKQLNTWYQHTSCLLEKTCHGDNQARQKLLDLLDWVDSSEAYQICSTIGLNQEFLLKRRETFHKIIARLNTEGGLTHGHKHARPD